MTTHPRRVGAAVWLVTVLAALAGLFVPAVSAAASVGPETRVRASDHLEAVLVGRVDLGSSTGVEVSDPDLRRLVSATGVATNFGRLSEVSPGVYRSPQGLVYGPGSAQGHRVTHVMEHARPVSGKPVHSVFQTTAQDLPGLTDEVLGIVDDAWAIRGPAVPGDPGKFIVPMGRTVGTTGETSVTIIVKPGTSEIITAFPS